MALSLDVIGIVTLDIAQHPGAAGGMARAVGQIDDLLRLPA